MRKNPWIFNLAIACLALTTAFLAGAQSRDEARQKTENYFNENDGDKDGRLTREEFPGRSRRLFDRIDANQDGFVTVEEDIAYRTQRSSRPRETGGVREDRDMEGVRIERDLIYGHAGERALPLDLYVPEGAKRPMPLIIWVHGGGWKGGAKGSGGKARGMLERGYAVADIEYRLSGEALFPAQIEDCLAAVRWLRANAATYGIDPNRFGAWGSSAGGHLVALMGTSGDAKDFVTQDHAGVSSRVQAVCDWFGPTNFLQMDAHNPPGARWKHDGADSPESRLVGGPIQEAPYSALAHKADPITHINKGDPPMLIMHGDKDLSVPVHQSELLHAALKKAKLDVTYHVVKGGGHGFRDATDETGEDLFNRAAKFFDAKLKR